MSSFYDTDLGVSRLGLEDLNKAALAGGRLGGIGYWYARTCEIPPRHGYGFAWVNTNGTGNCGTLVMVPRSREAAEYLRQGRVSLIMREHGLEYSDADALYSACCGVRYGMEAGVMAYAVMTRDCGPAWGHFPGVGSGVWRWFRDWRMPETDLSAPRLGAVAEILKRWR